MYLVDTSVWVHALRPGGAAGIQAKLRPLIVSGDAAVTEWILLELMTGLRKSDSPASLLRWFEPVKSVSSPADREWQELWTYAAKLRRHGVSVTAADCVVAWVSMNHDAPLIHCDSDFEAMKRWLPLKTEDWTVHTNR